MSMSIGVLAKKWLPDVILALLSFAFGSDAGSVDLGKFGELPAIPFFLGVLVVLYLIYEFREELIIAGFVCLFFIGIVIFFVHVL